MTKQISHEFSTELPSDQNAINIFSGRWISKLPDGAPVSGGVIPLFQDQRIIEGIRMMGGTLQGMKVVELGPFEGGHTYILHNAGASSIVAFEGNSVCYLKTLIAKEIFNLHKLKLIYGGIENWLEDNKEEFDLILASGVLYHLFDPLAALVNMAKRTKSILIWTHYFDDSVMQRGDPRLAPFTGAREVRELEGLHATYHHRGYQGAEQNENFCGGMEGRSVWMERKDIISILEGLGYRVRVYHETPNHQSGPACCFLAQRK